STQPRSSRSVSEGAMSASGTRRKKPRRSRRGGAISTSSTSIRLLAGLDKEALPRSVVYADDLRIAAVGLLDLAAPNLIEAGPLQQLGDEVEGEEGLRVA